MLLQPHPCKGLCSFRCESQPPKSSAYFQPNKNAIQAPVGLVPVGTHRHHPARARVIASASRAEELAKDRASTGGKVVDRPDIEADGRYARTDSSAMHIYQARTRFAHCISGGEPRMRLAEAALQISAEDDAVATLSTVPFPADSYLRRIDGVAQHVRATLDAQGLLPTGGTQPDPEIVLQVAEKAIFAEPADRKNSGTGASSSKGIVSLGYRAPPYGRSALPLGSVVDHPGVWEDARVGYMHEVLVRRVGHPSTLAVLYSEVMLRLLAWGTVDFAITVDVRGYSGTPAGTPIPGITRDMLLQPGATSTSKGSIESGSNSNPITSISSSSSNRSSSSSSSGGASPSSTSAPLLLNTCSSDTLVELLRTLKRAFWPFSWECSPNSGNDGHESGGSNSHGGFRAAAKAGVGEEMNAALRVMSRAAANRLDRGIWTSPGAGDIMRCRGACERLVMLVGEEQPEERRDLAVILLHGGEPGAARAELREYMATPYFKSAADPFDKALCYKLMDSLRSLGTTIQETGQVMSISAVLSAKAPETVQAVKRLLTW